MKKPGQVMKIYAALLFVMLCFLLNPPFIRAEAPPNTITFENQSGEPGLVKLIGPTALSVEVPVGGSRTVNAAAGEYHILVRYGNDPKAYRYSKGDPFTVTQTATKYSATSITLHKVVGGNYPSRPASSAEFDNAVVTREGAAKDDEKKPGETTGLPAGNPELRDRLHQ
ncbi:MAG: hypothetical protein HZB84_03675 [Deltaproteobacteria bacterium]|nr:hypothetical protein [Deltaproteobacteria bacterium]